MFQYVLASRLPGALPLSSTQNASPVWIVAQSMEATAKDKPHVLLVEDDPQDEVLVLQAFRKLGLEGQVAVVRDGAEALDYLFASGSFAHRDARHLPSLVLMDIHMPKFSGVEVLDRIRADVRSQYLPVIIFTASLSARDLLDCYRSGANSYVRKPVDFAGLIETMRQIWLYWTEVNQSPPSEPDR